jgi:DNA polymerase I-like protein with 3'-5' exonuclease and polymerase domains
MIFLDIETNTAHNTIWICVTMKDGVVKRHTSPDSLKQVLDGDIVCGHNIIGFDAPVLKKVWGVDINTSLLCDTLIMSRLYKPDIDVVFIEGQKAPSPHSLEAWGIRLGCHKIGFTNFDGGLTEEMATYCEQDVQLTNKLYSHLVTAMAKEGFSDQSIQLEHEVALICKQMEDNGFMLDERKAMMLQAELSGRMADIETKMQAVFPPIVEERISEKTGKKLKDKTTIFNPGSRQQICERLQGLGVVFTKKTDKGNFIVDEVVLESIDLPEAKLVAEYLMLQKRVAQIGSWLELVQDDGRVHGRVITNGAVTGRATHSNPNMAQVPAVGSPFGAECREMWTVAKGKVQVGVDLSGIELRCLGHYLQDKEWIEELLKGDIHWFNAQSFGLVAKGTVKDDNNTDHKKARNVTKTLTYGVLYGAGAAKAGSIVGGNSTRGRKLIDSFVNNTPGLASLKKKIGKFMTKGNLPGLDGRRVWIRSEHAALNTLLQSAGAIIAKQWLVEATKGIAEAGIDARLVAFVHDETQWEVDVAHAQQAVEIIEAAATKAGEVLQFRCPVDAEGKIGNNWRECH